MGLTTNCAMLYLIVMYKLGFLSRPFWRKLILNDRKHLGEPKTNMIHKRSVVGRCHELISTWKYCAWISLVKILRKRKLKVPVIYLEVECKADWRKHNKIFSSMRRKNIGTRRRKAERKRNPCTFANRLLTAVRNTCKQSKKTRVLVTDNASLAK